MRHEPKIKHDFKISIRNTKSRIVSILLFCFIVVFQKFIRWYYSVLLVLFNINWLGEQCVKKEW